ncbi:Sec-independent protein translocase subunit TatA [Compostimonas suwonensis]|uniref:Sec-independent protein translocase protein TatA n=1 Tax=Compostimonas suwonensis TaxID=1048394 RepID=A0A2M9C4I0_9MICO|nr:Sec-independent protein translocase subunit TatA [Compostimonas suwonensis]PJJ65434.1 sec-independent protein translocase protein TatA [Compostimonas suwonensis]
MFANLTGWHLIIILAVVLLLFGSTKLPALSRSIGQSMRIFRSETKAMKSDEAHAEQARPDSTSSDASGGDLATPPKEPRPASNS